MANSKESNRGISRLSQGETIPKRADSSNPDRVVATMCYMGEPIAIRQGGAERAAHGSLRGELRAMARATRYAQNVADGLVTLAELPESQQLDVRIVLRSRGLMALPGNGGNGAE